MLAAAAVVSFCLGGGRGLGSRLRRPHSHKVETQEHSWAYLLIQVQVK